MNRVTPDALYRLLPSILRLRDAEEGEPLRQLLAVIAREGAVVEESIEELLDNLFIETCADWAAPYIGGTIGYKTLHPIEGLTVGTRAEVANTIGYRRRKGTAAVLEQLARDVTGWPAKVVEYFQLTATCQHMNHVRPDHALAPDLHDPFPLEALTTAFDRITRTVDVRSIQQSPARQSVGGRHNFPNIGLHLWRLLDRPHSNVPSTRVGPRRFLFDPLGAPRQLVNPPLPEDGIASLARPEHVPANITRAALRANKALYYPRAFQIFVDGVAVPIEEIEACDLSDVGGVWNHSPHVSTDGGDVRVDPELGRIAFRDANPGEVRTTFSDAFPATIGGGEYSRAADFPATDQTPTAITDPTTDLDAELAAIASGGIIELAANEIFAAPVLLTASADREVVLRAADGFRPILRGDVEIVVSGGPNARVVLDGLTLDGPQIRVEPDGDGASLGELTLRNMTLIPGRGLTRRGLPRTPGAPSLVVEASGVELRLERSISGPVRATDTAAMRLSDSIVDAAALDSGDSPDGSAIEGVAPGTPAGELTIIASTVIGRILARSFPLVSNSILHARDDSAPPVRALRRQSGCMRFSFVPFGAITPRRFRCQPQLGIAAALETAREAKGSALTEAEAALISGNAIRRMVPGFTALGSASPAYAQLSHATLAGIAAGASDGSEMGVYHHLFQPQRITNLRVRLEEYLRFSLEAGLFFET